MSMYILSQLILKLLIISGGLDFEIFWALCNIIVIIKSPKILYLEDVLYPLGNAPEMELFLLELCPYYLGYVENLSLLIFSLFIPKIMLFGFGRFPVETPQGTHIHYEVHGYTGS